MNLMFGQQCLKGKGDGRRKGGGGGNREEEEEKEREEGDKMGR